jgi:nitrous oxide reductase family maturation protein NosD
MNARAAKYRDRRGTTAVLAAVALASLLAGAALPLWTMTLHAPQYPQGVRLIIDGRGARGDVDELNSLNHYIGMVPIPKNLADVFPEIQLFIPGLVAVATGIVLFALLPWPWLRALAVFGSWALPLGFLADLQWRLHQFGHTLEPAAFRLPPFTPRVLGPTVVMNFNVTALPGPGLLLFGLSAVVLTVAWRVARREAAPSHAVVAVVTTGLVLLLAAAPTATGAEAPPAFDLRAAIAAAPPGAVVNVPPGRYPGPITLQKSVTLLGGGSAVIDGGRAGDVVIVTGDDVRVEGFEIRGSALAYSSEAASVVVRGARAVIRGNRVEDTLFGVYLAGARDAVIESNVITAADLPLERRGHAIYLWRTRDTTVRGNRVTRAKDGLYIAFSDGNTIEDNTVTGSRYGIHYMYANHNVFRNNIFRDNAIGGAVMNSADVTLIGNAFEGSRSSEVGVGLIFKDVDRVMVRENRIVGNRVGFELDNAPSTADGWVRFERNLIAHNGVGFSMMSTTAITATENAIVENLRPVEARGAVRAAANRWTDRGRGNYWSDYNGFDPAGDGIGDIAYRRHDALEDLSSRHPVLRAFLFTPAHHAIDAATRLVPLVPTSLLVEDVRPLMRPPVHLAASTGTPKGLSMLSIGLSLLVPALAVVAIAGPRRRPRRRAG